MNKVMIKYVMGRLMFFNGLFLLLPVLVSIYYRENPRYLLSFLSVALFSLILGYYMGKDEPKRKNLYAKEGFIIVTLTWLSMSLIGSIPFILSGDFPSVYDAIFESTSGFTTTGMTILNDVENLSKSVHFWRAFTQFLGGIGILVFALAMIPSAETKYINVLKVEASSPRYGKLLPRVTDSTRYLFGIYLGLSVLVAITLVVFGMSPFDAIIHMFGVAGTGGFSLFNTNISMYNSLAIETVLAIGMFLFGINFNLFFLAVSGHFKKALNHDELWWYVGIIISSIILVTLNIYSIYQSFPEALHQSVFTVIAMITSTGIELTPLGQWPIFSKYILLLLMIIGGMAGSTSGGFKISRVIIITKTLIAEIKRNVYPNRIVTIHFEDEPVDERVIEATARYLIVYMFVFVMLLAIMTLEFKTLSASFSVVTATLNNIGVPLGTLGETETLSSISPLSKMILSLAMITGRLEIYPILIFLTPSIWHSYN